MGAEPRPPGRGLRALARLLYGEDLTRRVVDPLLADLQAEWREGLDAGRTRDARRARWSGYAACCATLFALIPAALGTLAERIAMPHRVRFLLLTGWLLPSGLALMWFGRWVREIVVPTLKGGDFDRLYDLHGVRYLDLTLAMVVVAFVWVAAAAIHLGRSISRKPGGPSPV